MTDAFYYNETQWAKAVGKQGARLIQGLLNRTGGAEDPEMTLSQVVDQITTVNQVVDNMSFQLSAARQSTDQSIQIIKNLQQTIERNNELIAALNAQLNQYEHRINQLENEI